MRNRIELSEKISAITSVFNIKQAVAKSEKEKSDLIAAYHLDVNKAVKEWEEENNQ